MNQNDRLQEAQRVFDTGYKSGLSEADRRKVSMAKRFARELRKARSEAERREVASRYKAAMRKLKQEEEGAVRPREDDDEEGYADEGYEAGSKDPSDFLQDDDADEDDEDETPGD